MRDLRRHRRPSPANVATIAALHCLALVTPAAADEVQFAPILDLRISGEQVRQDALPDPDSEAVTLRARPGMEARLGDWRVLVQGQATVALIDDYYDGLEGEPDQPLIADPESIGLYRAQARYLGGPLAITLGRQRLSFDNDRFVDAASVRQNSVSYDGLRVQWSGGGLSSDVAYIWNVRTIWGAHGAGPRPEEISGESAFANFGYALPAGELTAYAYLIDQDEVAIFDRGLSSQTYGVRFAGAHQFDAAARLLYQASLARQSDYGQNPNDYLAAFYLLDAALEFDRIRLGLGLDVSGADGGAELTSFQFPYGSGFRYRGNAGKFQIVPPDGLRDLYLSAGYGAQRRQLFDSLRLQATYHHFSSDRAPRSYGQELDLSASAARGPYALALRYADYMPDGFARRTQKLALQLEWSF